MKKKIFAITSVIAIMAANVAVQTVSASEPLDSTTKSLVAESADEMIANLSEATVYSVDAAENEADAISYDINDAYSVVVLESNPILTYKECGTFSGVLSDETRITLPYSEGEMSFDLEGEFLGMWEGEGPVMYPAETDALIQESLPGKNVNVTYTYSGQYSATLVYVQDTDTGEEYIIPYMYIAGIEQSLPPAVYALNDFMTAMDAVFDEEILRDRDSDTLYFGSGGAPMKDTEAKALFALTPVTPAQEAEASAMPVWSWVLIGAGAVLVLGGTGFAARKMLAGKDVLPA